MAGSMSLLRDIQRDIDAHSDLAVLLRKCKVLAARLGNDEFKNWVDSELSGYPLKSSLPDYRIAAVHSKGHFSGAFGRQLNSVDMPLICVPEELREDLSNVYLTMSVATMQSLADSGDPATNLQEPWDASIVAFIGKNFFDGMNCIGAWKVVPRAALTGVLDVVRTRILSFVLEIEAENPDAGEAPINSTPVPQEKLVHIYKTVIHGDVQNFASGNSGDVVQHAVYLGPGDAAMLNELLEAINAVEDGPGKSALAKVVMAMKVAPSRKEFGARYKEFISTLADHMQVLGTVVAPFLPALSNLA